MNIDRLVGDLEFFLTGNKILLTYDSIYTRLLDRDGYIETVYSDCIRDTKGDDFWDFEEYAFMNEYDAIPCISSVQRMVRQDYKVHFTRVDSKQFPYDIACIKALIGNDKNLSVTIGVIKEWKV